MIYLINQIVIYLAFSLHNFFENFPDPGPMKRKPVDILHACLTNQFLILLVAILLSLLVIFLTEKTPSHIGEFWI